MNIFSSVMNLGAFCSQGSPSERERERLFHPLSPCLTVLTPSPPPHPLPCPSLSCSPPPPIPSPPLPVPQSCTVRRCDCHRSVLAQPISSAPAPPSSTGPGPHTAAALAQRHGEGKENRPDLSVQKINQRYPEKKRKKILNTSLLKYRVIYPEVLGLMQSGANRPRRPK